MKYRIFQIIFLFSLFCIIPFDQSISAAGDSGAGVSGIYGDTKTDIDLRTGNITMNDIPKIIAGFIEILLGIAGTISIVALIYHAVQMQLASGIMWDSSGVDKAKAWMKGALLGFALSLSAWFLITKFVELLTTST